MFTTPAIFYQNYSMLLRDRPEGDVRTLKIERFKFKL